MLLPSLLPIWKPTYSVLVSGSSACQVPILTISAGPDSFKSLAKLSATSVTVLHESRTASVRRMYSAAIAMTGTMGIRETSDDCEKSAMSVNGSILVDPVKSFL